MAEIERQLAVPSAFVRAAPDEGAPALGQMLFGERLAATAERSGWVRGVSVRDGCAGWVDADALAEPTLPTHRVRSVTTGAQPSGSAGARFPLNALVTAERAEGGWVRDPRAGWFATDDLALVGADLALDAAEIALRFLGVGHAPGARDGRGFDAVGLVQQALYACGLSCPRDLGALAQLGRAASSPERGDLAVWPEHAGLLVDSETLVHADPRAGAVRLDDLGELAARLGGPPTLRRL